MHHNLGLTSHAHSTARNSQLEHTRATVVHGRVSLNSENSVRGIEDGGQRFCVPGETKLLSTSTRRGVRCSAVDESSHPQQTPLKLHEETWAGLLHNLGSKIFREVEIVPRCVVAVACPSCPDRSPEPPGPGGIIRNMLGWSQMEKTDRSGGWFFGGALQGVIKCRTQACTERARAVRHETLHRTCAAVSVKSKCLVRTVPFFSSHPRYEMVDWFCAPSSSVSELSFAYFFGGFPFYLFVCLFLCFPVFVASPDGVWR